MIIDVMGSVKRRGQISIDVSTSSPSLSSSSISVEEILFEAGGMKSGKKLKLVQVGGPLGRVLNPWELDVKVEELIGEDCVRQVMFISDPFCPVDYIRFLTRYCIRELKEDIESIRLLNKSIEAIANGNANQDEIECIQSIISDTPQGTVVERLFAVIHFVLNTFEDDIVMHIREKKCKSGICRGLISAQCINACPGEVHVPGYVELMKQEKYKEAYALMRKANPLSLICGYVCARPCENRCRRGEIESSVGVRALKKYASTKGIASLEDQEDRLESNGKRVAVIGAGPAGLSSAYYLARTGYSVTVFESEDKPGGMLAYGIPEYRLPLSVIESEVELIEKLGVDIRLNTKVGQDIQLDDIEKMYDAVLLATGRPVGVKQGEEHSQITSAVEFLKDVRMNSNQKREGKTAVVGGGDVAIDAARTSLRLGADKVYLVSLESMLEMPASDDEKDNAIKEGVEFINMRGIESIEYSDDAIKSIALKHCKKVLDKNGRFAPEYDLSDIMIKEVDQIIYAIGQAPDLSYLSSDIQVENNRLTVNRKFESSKPGVFAVGDVIKAGIAIDAIAEGRKAAESIDDYLNGSGLYLGDDIIIPQTQLDSTMWDIKQRTEKHIKHDELTGNFSIDTSSLSWEEADSEAKRCMRCDRNSREPLYLRRFK